VRFPLTAEAIRAANHALTEGKGAGQKVLPAEDVGFEPTVTRVTLVFKTNALGH
jgi:hypothetical protein